MFLLASVLLCVCVLVVPGTSVTCNIDPSDSCKCSFADGGKTWNIDISKYFTTPLTPSQLRASTRTPTPAITPRVPKTLIPLQSSLQYV
ncbi:hypothetical protein GBAR_LOCUS14036 [Geodia barretti]|uniref:Uncharacterized protein n=1 Tax=Geodia barretti TaxID=519541 RepID=A0AA35S8K4_GEOBA|nr:hypothetical protein GBAR_LOCUS14036 [Geodia barretti]